MTDHPRHQDPAIGPAGAAPENDPSQNAEPALSRQNALQEILMAISTKYINLPLDQVETAINTSLQELGEFVGADRAYVFDYHFAQGITTNTYEWCEEGVTPEIDNLQEVPLSMLNFWVETHTQGKTMYVPDVQALPPGGLREILEPQNIKSLIAVPMMDGEKCLGFVGFDAVRRHYQYSEKERALLKLFAQMLVNIRLRSEAEKQLQASREQLQKLTENVPGAIYQFEMNPDGEMNFTFISQGVSQIHPQLTPEKLKSNTLAHFSVIHPDDLERVYASILESQHALSQYQFDFRIVLDDGSVRWNQAISKPEKRADGAVVWYGIIQDITPQKEFEAARKIAQRLEIEKKEMEQFTYIASHDLKEPIRTLKSFAGLLAKRYQGKLDENADQYLNFITDASNRMNQVITALLNYSKLGRNRVQTEVNCRELLDYIEKDLVSVIDAANARLHICDLPVIRGFELELRQLFQNLISNAIKFSKEGVRPEIHIQADEDRAYWHFAVQDNGIGIPEAFHEKIFNIFQRLHSRETYEGTGIGLAHCKKIVELHHGKIWVESAPGAGSTFHFTISKKVEFAPE